MQVWRRGAEHVTSVNVITYFIIPTGSSIVKAGGLPNRDDKQQEKGAELFSKLYFLPELLMREFIVQ